VKGSGLGLFLSFKKARLLGGNLTVNSPYERPAGKIRKGSCFTLKIPYYAQNEVSGK
jgi:signal transduction histidine kinase